MKQSSVLDSEKTKKILNFSGLYCALLIILVGLIFFNSKIFEVKSVLVRGNDEISTEDILRMANLNSSKNIFQIDCAKVENALLHNPKIGAVKVYYQLPNQVVIDVQEREAFCLLFYSDNLLIISEDSVVMGVKAEDEPIKLPIITGISLKNIHIGQVVNNSQFRIAMDILKLAGESLRRNLSEVNLKNYQLYIDLPSSHYTLKVELGNSEKLEEKIVKNLRSILSHTAPDELSKIDLRVPSFPTVIKNTSH